MKVRSWWVAGVVFAVLWVFVRGAALAPRPLLGQFLLGLAVGVPVAYVFRRLYERHLSIRRSIRGVPYAFGYLAVFLKEVLVANLDMTYRVLAPGMPLQPQVILVPLRVRTDLGITTIANSITVTPGTLALDHDPDENALYVHIVDGRDPHAVVAPIRAWEAYALEIFDEPLSPDAPAPEITIHPPNYPPEPKRHSLDELERETIEEAERRAAPFPEGGPAMDDGADRSDTEGGEDDGR